MKKNRKAKKHFRRFVVAKVHPWSESRSVVGTDKSKVELLDIDNNFKWHYTWVSDSNMNYAEWQKIYHDDYKNNAYVIEGHFSNKKQKDLINADAVFTITEVADREELFDLIRQDQKLHNEENQ